MRIQFNNLFYVCSDPNILEAWDDTGWVISFRRSLHGNLVDEWESLLLLLNNIKPDPNTEDEVSWVIDNCKAFTTKSLYYALTHGASRIKFVTYFDKAKYP